MCAKILSNTLLLQIVSATGQIQKKTDEEGNSAAILKVMAVSVAVQTQHHCYSTQSQ